MAVPSKELNKDAKLRPFFCMKRSDLDKMLRNILKLDNYKNKLKELLKGTTQ